MRRVHQLWPWWYGILQLFLLIALGVQPVAAHTEDAIEQLSQVPMGPYRMTVWTYPGVMRAGAIHYTVALVDTTADLQPLNHANVLIKAMPLTGQAAEISDTAVQGVDLTNPSFYETDLVLTKRGDYQIEVTLQDLSGQIYTQSFQIEIVSGTSLKVVITLFLVLTVTFTLWFLKESLRTWGLNHLLVRNQVAWAKTRTRTKQSS